MKDVMIDLETFGNGKNACVVQIGGCYFDRFTGELGEKIKLNVDARSAIASGAEFDADTIYWWLSQDRRAIESVTSEPMLDIAEAFARFNTFLTQAEAIWSHATFDFVITTETFKRLNIKTIFPYRAARDIRTLVDLAGVNTKEFARDGVHHDALDDCIFQIKYCVHALNILQQRVAR